jgi:hypothetical protein
MVEQSFKSVIDIAIVIKSHEVEGKTKMIT